MPPLYSKTAYSLPIPIIRVYPLILSPSCTIQHSNNSPLSKHPNLPRHHVPSLCSHARHPPPYAPQLHDTPNFSTILDNPHVLTPNFYITRDGLGCDLAYT